MKSRPDARMPKARARFLAAVLGVLALGSTRLPAQMEKRAEELYDAKALAEAVPAVGTPAPDLVLTHLDGRPWALSARKGRTLVLIKGGWT
jgi:hypothetical protein